VFLLRRPLPRIAGRPGFVVDVTLRQIGRRVKRRRDAGRGRRTRRALAESPNQPHSEKKLREKIFQSARDRQ